MQPAPGTVGRGQFALQHEQGLVYGVQMQRGSESDGLMSAANGQQKYTTALS